MWLISVPVATTLLGFSVTGAVIPRLRSASLLDAVNHRSSHTATTVRGGGVAVLLVFAVGTAVLFAFGPSAVRFGSALALAACAVIAFGLLGWFEDVHGLSVRTRLLTQVAIASLAAISAVLLGAGTTLSIVGALIAVFYVNAANFVDGINGISSLHAMTAGLYFFWVGQQVGNEALSLVALCGAGAFFGFLPWNFPVARIFLGDVGSYTLGAFVWALAFWTATETTPLVAAAPMVVYSADVLFTLGRRVRRGESLGEAHREHVYQRLQRASGSHAAAALAVTAATIVCCSAAGLVLVGEIPHTAGVILCAAIAILFCAVPTAFWWSKGVTA